MIETPGGKGFSPDIGSFTVCACGRHAISDHCRRVHDFDMQSSGLHFRYLPNQIKSSPDQRIVTSRCGLTTSETDSRKRILKNFNTATKSADTMLDKAEHAHEESLAPSEETVARANAALETARGAHEAAIQPALKIRNEQLDALEARLRKETREKEV